MAMRDLVCQLGLAKSFWQSWTWSIVRRFNCTRYRGWLFGFIDGNVPTSNWRSAWPRKFFHPTWGATRRCPKPASFQCRVGTRNAEIETEITKWKVEARTGNESAVCWRPHDFCHVSWRIGVHGWHVNGTKTKVLTTSTLQEASHVEICGTMVAILHGEMTHKYLGRKFPGNLKSRTEVEFMYRI